MAMLPAFGLITYETRKWLTQHRPDLAQTLPNAELELVESIRNASKWFDASKDGQDVLIERFRALTVDHKAQFMGNTPFLWARKWETDLGLYTHRGVDVLDTHLIGTILGADAWEKGAVVRDMSATVSGQAAALTSEREDLPSFMDALQPFGRRDVRSDDYYSVAGMDDIAESGYLHLLRTALAFLELLTPASPRDEGVLFKLQFVGLYHATRAIRRLDASVAPPNLLTDGDGPRQLRNDLVHYSPNHAYPISALDGARPRQALAEHAFNESFSSVAGQVRSSVATLHTQLRVRLGH
ncbi:hypothetical protein J7E45_08755 [Microbacterium sp. ISL-59]|uniref:hypothetical protein n=1 Tax=Microbacterium sp. ISL-59 TaxID=2819159 RepID=UPI001BE5E461|nr:hypothetical protein [Microbacterium sp. ISL-59]MBT2495696.1 hypothetical protein [Microbacterium sp. ISL-59]